MKKIIFITGGARSGKSTYALKLAGEYEDKIFVATAIAFDAEMEKRIEKHKVERDPSFTTIEEPVKLGRLLGSLPGSPEVLLLDCLTVWLCNLVHDDGSGDRLSEIDEFIEKLKDPPCDMIIVSNELGMGVVPDNPMAREFRDKMGFVNQRVAAIADEVVFMVSGQPMSVKR